MMNHDLENYSLSLSDLEKKPTMYYRCKNTLDWEMKFVSDSCQEVLECSADELLKNSVIFGKLILIDEALHIWETIQKALACHRPYQLIYHINTPRKHLKTLFEQGHAVYATNGEIFELQGFITDISTSIALAESNLAYNYFELFSQEIIQTAERINCCKITALLSEREIETLIYHCQGMGMKEIGAKLKISPRTIEAHLTKLKLKLLCYTLTELRKLFFITQLGRKLIHLF